MLMFSTSSYMLNLLKLLAYSFGLRHVDSWEIDEFTCLLDENSIQ